MTYRTHLTLTARHTGLNLVGTRSLVHANATACANHGASIQRSAHDAFRSIDGSHFAMRPDSPDRCAMSGSPWIDSVVSSQPCQPRQKPSWPTRGVAVVRGVHLPVVRGAATSANGQPGWPGDTAEPRGERVEAE